MIIELKDKGLELEFPDDMPLDKIKAVIQKQFYPIQAEQADLGMVDFPMPAVPPSVLSMWDKALTEEAPVAGAMLPGPLGALGGGLGKAYQMMRTGEQPQLPAWSEEMESVPGGIPEAFPKPTNLMDAMGLGAAGWGAGKVAEKVVAPAIGAVTAPMGKVMDRALAESATARAAKELADEGVPIGVEQYAPSLTGRAMTWVLDKFPLSRGVMDTYRGQLNKTIMQMREDLVQKTLGMADPSIMASTAKLSTKEAFSELSKGAGGPQVKLPVPNVQEAIQNALKSDASVSDSFWSNNPIVKKLRDQPTGQSYEKILNSFLDPNHPEVQAFARRIYERQSTIPELTFADINSLNSTIFKSGKANVFQRLTSEQRGLRESVRTAIGKDLGSYDAKLSELFTEAMGKAKFERELPKAKVIEGLLSKASKIDESTGNMRFFPAQFNELMRINRDKLNNILGSEKYKLLEQFRDKTMAAVPDLTKLNQKSSIAESALSLGLGGGALYGAITSPWLAVPSIFSPLVAMSIMKPSGWLRKWLSTGFKPPAMSMGQGAKVATLSTFGEGE